MVLASLNETKDGGEKMLGVKIKTDFADIWEM